MKFGFLFDTCLGIWGDSVSHLQCDLSAYMSLQKWRLCKQTNMTEGQVIHLQKAVYTILQFFFLINISLTYVLAEFTSPENEND